ncbi:hypothetical protein FE257_007796 [Aspergillus nanangensis]|uniref:ubiquitinyl hydrolase 1 n=1 Tax=Aspergillus nanangensis TaxID=2582783 RepID=A0AAD4CXI7_ASPNN|nr:hypothetical protein FE257_007796 [Aspergillus nanangensis]
MEVSDRLFQFFFHHIILPPQLPQQDDESEVDAGERLELKLSQFVLQHLDSYTQDSPESQGCWQIVKNMLASWIEVDQQGTVCQDTLARVISELKSQGATALYIRAQNCGWIAHYDNHNNKNKIIFDAFEVSARPTDVLATSGSLQRRVPGVSVAIPAETIHEPEFCKWLANTLSRFHIEEVEKMMATTKKAKTTVTEERDTAHPGLVTECLMTQPLAFGEHNSDPIFPIFKNTRDEVNWGGNNILPWRRSPRWYVMRVAMQTLLHRLFSDKDGYNQYKNFMLYLVANLGSLAIDRGPSVSADQIYLIRDKVGHRINKLKDDVYSHVAEQAQSSVADMTSALQKIQQEINVSNRVLVPESFDLTQEDLGLSLSNCREYLITAMTSTPGDTPTSQFNRKYGPRLSYDKHGLPKLQSGDFLLLVDVENWVETMLETWLRNQEVALCCPLADLFNSYSGFAEKTYMGCPDLISIMLLTMLELWVAIDKLCINIDPRLKDHSPELPEKFLEPLLLPQRHQMKRASKIETYIRARHENQKSGLPNIFCDPTAQSFAISYFDSSNELQELRTEIETYAEAEKQAKHEEWVTKSDQYRNLLSEANGIAHEKSYTKTHKLYHNRGKCHKCALQKQALSISINVYEWPLPSDEDTLKAVVFEPHCPAWFCLWRDVTWRLVQDVGRYETRQTSVVEHSLFQYNGLMNFAVQHGQRLTLGSKIKSWTKTHYNTRKFPVDFDNKVSLPNTLQFRLLDTKTKSWVKDQNYLPILKPRTTLSIPESAYAHLQYAVASFLHTENEVIADQQNCPSTMSMHEFVAFGSLRAGERVQWYNIVRELASSALSMNEESVGILLRQAAWEMGTPHPNTDLRKAHVVFETVKFVHTLLDTLEQRLDSIDANWNEHRTLHSLIIIGLRVLSLSKEPSTENRAIEFLRRSRQVAIKWCEALIINRDNQTGLQGDTQRLLERIGFICQCTYSAETNHLPALLRTEEDLYLLARSSIVVFENTPRDSEGSPTDVRSSLIWTSRILCNLESQMREIIDKDSVGLNNAITKTAHTLVVGSPWKACTGGASRWITSQTKPTRLVRQQTIHYKLLTGELLVENRPPGRLPKEYSQTPLFKKLFGTRTINVVPSSLRGSVFMSSHTFGVFQVHFGMEYNELIIKTQNGDRILRLIPHEKLEGDFPDSFIFDYVHWLDTTTGVLEFRPLEKPWRPNKLNWCLSIDMAHPELATMNQGGRKMLDIRSKLFQQLADVLRAMDAPRHMVATLDESSTIQVEMVRMRLKFFVNADGALETPEVNATVDRDQDIGCLYGLMNKLVLRDTRKDSRSVLIPYGRVELLKQNNHTLVSICATDEPRIHYFLYSFDQHLRMLRGPLEPSGTIYQVYMHALTSYVLPDPATNKTGTEEALRILHQAWLKTSFPLDKKCIDLLREIATLTPQRLYYPFHLKAMQVVRWNRHLNQLSQHDDFYALVCEIVDDANKFSRFHGVSAEEQTAAIDSYRQRGDQHLLERARCRHAHFRHSEAHGNLTCPNPRPSCYHGRDWDTGSDRSGRVYAVATLIRDWPSSVNDCKTVFKTIKKWKYKVQDFLNKMRYQEPVDQSIPLPPDRGLPPPSSSCQIPDIFCMLQRSSPLSTPEEVPAVFFVGEYGSQDHSSSIHSELNTLFDNLCDQTDRHRRQLGISLQESLEALSKRQLPSVPSSLPVERSFLLEKQKALVDQRDQMWSRTCMSLTRTENTWQQISATITWPRLTIFSALSLLARGRWELVPDQWKKTLQAFAKSIASLRRLERLLTFHTRGDVDGFYKESQTIPGSGWDSEVNPEWLLFEIENDLTIREQQATVAKEMIRPTPGGNAVLQLTMGEGKTSVITPMIALALTDSTQLLRIMVLKPLLRQSINLLSRLGCMLNRRVYHIPFSRDTPLDSLQLAQLQSIYQDCLASGDILVTIPEHILSFRLIGLDLADRDPDFAQNVIRLETWLNGNCRNLIDESDEVLDPKFQPSYTVGQQQSMDGDSDRWEVTQSLLALVEEQAIELQHENSGWLDVERNGSRFPILHFLKANTVQVLVKRLFTALGEKGLAGIPLNHDVKILRSCFEDGIFLRKLLVLRGLFAHQILHFVLTGKRWLVDYGLHPSRCIMAVPYRAKGVPSENAEFGHPDVAIALTCLSYYYHGLTENQVRHCFSLLDKENDASAEYQNWVTRDISSLPTGLRQLSGANLDDATLLKEVLYPHLNYQKGLIDFFLSRVVFPREAKEFPYKLCTSAWDLPSRTGQPLTTGFSGTNDNRFLLPYSTPQRDLPHLIHTNAMVLSHLLRQENRQCVLARDKQGHRLRARPLVDLINSQEPPVRVIIDVGAQILESSNHSIAEYWLSVTPTAEGAIYFDENDEAVVVDCEGHIERLFASPFRHRMDTCLVFMDQQHTRGVDLKLPGDYRAAVTLGPRLTKDRLMQVECVDWAAASLCYISPPEVGHSITIRVNETNSFHVIQWALEQTSESLKALSPLWASHGLQYYKRIKLWDTLVNGNETQQEVVSKLQEPEARTLSQLYAPWDPSQFETIDNQHDRDDPIIQELLRLHVGQAHARLHEEQERQVSHEVQREQQVYRPPKVSPQDHKLHGDIHKFVKNGKFPARETSAVQPAFEALRQSSLGEYNIPSYLAPGLYATSDFIQTVDHGEWAMADEFSRPVRWVVSNCHNSDLLLISQFEANELLPAIQGSRKTKLHVYTARTTKGMRSFRDLRFLHIGAHFNRQVSLETTRSLELFAGSLYFQSYSEYEDFRHFLGLVTNQHNCIPEDRVSQEGFVDQLTRQEFGWPVQSPFDSSPIQFLSALFNLRSKGHGYDQTHVGVILGARALTPDQIESGEARVSEITDEDEDGDVEMSI